MIAFAVLLAVTLADDALSKKLSEEFRESPVVNVAEIDVRVKNRIVTLEGEVFNLEADHRAVEIARAHRDVRAVVDLLDVAVVPRSDRELESLIRKRLSRNEATADLTLDIRTDQGRVVLAGETDSEVEAELAVRIVRSIPGVQFIDDRLRVRRCQDRTDEDIAADVRQRVRWDHHLDEFQIDVDVKDGVVKLSGRVGSDSDRFHAFLAARIDGVREVDNELGIEELLRDDVHRDALYRIDLKPSEIEAAIREAWQQDPRVGQIDPEVRVVMGAVTLRGDVNSLAEKRSAEQTAINTTGVSQLRSYLRVKNARTRSDESIRRDIEDAFANDPLVDRFEIRVSVDEGDVFLRGTVDSHYERARAEEVALHIPGIIELHNRLEVSEKALEFDPTFYAYEPVKGVDPTKIGSIHIKPDEDIRRAIESELWWSPFIDSDEVKVKVDAGVATLTGTVDSQAEVAAAVSNAMQGGAVVVRNNLKIRRR
jgi:osmotically-inducible protein OsmY